MEETKNKSVFATLNAIDVSDHTEVKGEGKDKLTYHGCGLGSKSRADTQMQTTRFAIGTVNRSSMTSTLVIW